MNQPAPRYDRPSISLIATGLGDGDASLFIGGADGARDLGLMRRLDIVAAVNCAVNLDINYVAASLARAEAGLAAVGHAPLRTYKIGMVDGPGNSAHLMLAGYYILDAAMMQHFPERASYPNRARGNVLVHCRGGRSRSVALSALYIARKQPHLFHDLDAAIAHIRQKRELRPDEWFETPKPELMDAVREAMDMLNTLEG